MTTIDEALRTLESEKIRLRRDAVGQLKELADARSLPAFIKALTSDPDEYVRIDAAEALGRIGDWRATPALLMALKSDELLTLLQADWESLSSITDKDEHNKRWFFLADTMAAQISDIRRAAAIALGQLGDADAVGGLIDALHDKADANVRDAAAQALRMIGTLAALAALTRD